ncbi:helix-turn-helix transcriptional regulator [Clostridium sp. DSM 8431]|uniref:helix-turn-helix domain-containing protein n=1 Tax=Clostridium sp. DSM 8431 TaxID=1761781 RepID=UPI000B7C7BC6|nr:helix-turn-helix transcriptional regulator [Clostridium sp. DSM 8431]
MCNSSHIATYNDKIDFKITHKEVYKVEEDDSTGAILRKLRLQRGMTAEELSSLIGISAENIRHIERSKINLSHKTIRAFYKVFKDDIKIDNYTRYVLSDANIKFCEYMKANNLTNSDMVKYLGISEPCIIRLKRSTNITHSLFKRIESKLKEMDLLK